MTGCVGSTDADGQLVSRFLQGSEAAFEELFRKYQRRFFAVCLSFLGDRTEAEDAVQDAFLDIYAGLPRFGGRSAFHTWAYRIVTRKCLERRRKARRSIGQFSSPDPPDVPGGEAGVTALVVRQALDRLPDEARMVLLLRYEHELSGEEIAAVLGCNLGQAKMRLHRARNLLRARLEQPEGERR